MTSTPGPHARRLSAAAATLFGARGYAAVGVDEIAAAVGTTGPSFYRHFDTKYDLLRTLHLTAAARIERSIPRVGPTTVHGLSLGAIAVRRSLGTLRRDRSFLVEPDSCSVAEALGRVRASVTARVRHDRADLPPPEVDVATSAVLSLVSSVGTHRTALAAGAAATVLSDAAARMIGTLPATAPRTDPRARDRPIAGTGLSAVGKRETMLAAAAHLFDERGTSEVTVAEIAATVDLATSSTYRYFGGKNAIIGEVCLGSARRTAEGTARILADHDDPRQALLSLVAQRVQDAIASPALRVTRRYMAALDPAVARQVRHMARQERAEWVNLLTLACPELPRAGGVFLVEGAFTLIDDLSPRIDPHHLTALASSALV